MAVFLEEPTLLQSALAAAPLARDPETTWSFLRDCDILAPDAEGEFLAVSAAELARGEITGPQLSLRVDAAIHPQATPNGGTRDPGHRRAVALWQRVAQRAGGAADVPRRPRRRAALRRRPRAGARPPGGEPGHHRSGPFRPSEHSPSDRDGDELWIGAVRFRVTLATAVS